jgi:hypothetical protein
MTSSNVVERRLRDPLARRLPEDAAARTDHYRASRVSLAQVAKHIGEDHLSGRGQDRLRVELKPHL